ncbi:MAG: hypothetical protein ACOC5M_01680 [Chloroflexota bacterium]
MQLDDGTATHGLQLRQGDGSARLEMQCPHQNGLLYIVPADLSWVCDDELRAAHALAGFLKELSALDEPAIRELMNRWGLYYRSRPLPENDEQPGQS